MSGTYQSGCRPAKGSSAIAGATSDDPTSAVPLSVGDRGRRDLPAFLVIGAARIAQMPRNERPFAFEHQPRTTPCIVETTCNRLFRVRETGSPDLAHVWYGVEMKRLRGSFGQGQGS